MSKHIPVFKNEISANLQVQDGQILVDLTVGGAGHFQDMLDKANSNTVIGFDVDLQNITKLALQLDSNAQISEITQIQFNGSRIILINRNFNLLVESLDELGIETVDYVLADLGWSTDQLDSISGLSFKHDDADLDMRFDQNLQVTAADLLNSLSYKELTSLFEGYSDIHGKQLRKLVDAIIEQRKTKRFNQVSDLKHTIENIQNSALHHGSREFSGSLLARVFQALRIAVNGEITSLQSLLPQIWSVLNPEGVFQIITFHSGEEKVVKNQIDEWRSEFCISTINQQPYLRPSVAELRNNLAARSAKLWSYKKC